jgi:ribose 5-phosphate isomerase A
MELKKEAAKKAVSLIRDQSRIGLGAGSTIQYMVDFLKEEKEKGLMVQLLTPSVNTRQLLEQNGFEVGDTSSTDGLDQYFDGCDQFDKDLNALKSGGGIHTLEKLLAAMADEFILVGDVSKYVENLETRIPLAVEVLHEALAFVPSRVQELFGSLRNAVMRMGKGGEPQITTRGNYLFDLWFEEWPPLSLINPALKNIPGILETSLFYGMANKAVMASNEEIRILVK